METTNPKDWAEKKEIKILELPSGARIKVKSAKLYPLLTANLLPMATLENVSKGKFVSGEREPQERTEERINQLRDTVQAMGKMADLIIRVVIEPRIIKDGEAGEGEIHIVDIPDDDLKFLFSYILRAKEAEELSPFPSGEAGASH